MGRSRAKLALILQHDGQIVVRVGEIRPQSDDLLQLGGGLAQLAELGQQDSQVVAGFGQIGPKGQNPAIDVGRRGQPAGAQFLLHQRA